MLTRKSTLLSSTMVPLAVIAGLAAGGVAAGGVTFVIATHDAELGKQADRVLRLAEGVLVPAAGDGSGAPQGVRE